MKRIYIYCEGQTEESFTKKVLYDYFLKKNIIVDPIVCLTKRTPDKKYKGGIVKFEKFSKELGILCRSHPNELVTTMIDYYGLPDDFPMDNESGNDIYQKVKSIERSIESKLGMANLIVYLSLHEYESLLFSDPQAFIIFGESKVEKIQAIKTDFDNNPEAINNSIETAPHKRIFKEIPNYSKVSDGTRLAKEIGIGKMMCECKHFKEWLARLENY